MKNVQCPLCGDAPNQVVGEKGIVAKGGPLVSVRNVLCMRCGLIFQNPQPDKDELRRLTERYTESRHGVDTPEALRGYLATLDNDRKGAGIRDVLREFVFSGARVLEIGCGPGVALRALRDDLGATVQGVEPSSVVAALAKENGIPIFVGTFDQYVASKSEGGFDVVMLHHVFEHVPEPFEALRKIRSLLSSEGVLYIEVPDVSDFTKPVDHFFDAMHLWNFTPGTLAAVLRRAGFKVLRRTSKPFRIQLIAAPIEHAAPELSHAEISSPSPEAIARSLRIKRLRDAARKIFKYLNI